MEIERFRGVLERQGERFLSRIFTAAEQKYCLAHRDPAPYFAVRFAAKEAAFKALGTGWARGITWLDVEVRREEGGAPRMELGGRAREYAGELGVSATHLSLSHSEASAIALVILEK
jgi:holo-[acyl-carrier protein] synthase